MIKKILLFLLAGLIVIQFFHPKPNKSKRDQPNFIGKTFNIPDDVTHLFKVACFDCHSNNTRYPWYANIQPIDWWLAKHINEGKKGLNFDEYSNKRLRYQYHKMEEVIEQVKEGEMPLNSYTWTHKDAKLTKEERVKLTGWAQSVMDTLKARYPLDSLVRKKQ
jgi:DNA replicative helicase MCM subunit Mcm2 (Cdc46/Mcm family)